MKPEVLTSEAKKILPRLDSFSNFYLAGGTGLALQLGHRISVDLDLFTEGDLESDFLSQVKEVFSESEVEVVIDRIEQLMLEIGGVGVTFVKYPFPVLSGFIDYKGVSILPAKEIAAMKAYSIGRRATYKDYVDLYFVLKKEVTTLEEIAEFCEKKYEKKFDKRLFLEQLVYLEDVEVKDIQFIEEEVGPEEMLAFFEKKIKRMDI